MPQSYWLLKSEPAVFSIGDLQRAPDQTTPWEGVRNYQARNFIRDQMRIGDRVLFYHSNATPSGVAGEAEVASGPYPDPSAFDRQSPYFDPKSKLEQPTWYLVDVRWKQTFPVLLPLERLKADTKLTGLELLRRGSRLSVQPVSRPHFQHILKLAKSQIPAS
jgi:predicted RNA-binding protein with PUA-like domain